MQVLSQPESASFLLGNLLPRTGCTPVSLSCPRDKDGSPISYVGIGCSCPQKPNSLSLDLVSQITALVHTL